MSFQPFFCTTGIGVKSGKRRFKKKQLCKIHREPEAFADCFLLSVNKLIKNPRNIGFMFHAPKKETVVSLLLVIGIFYFSFMILDRVLSLIYGFNFQPYGPYMPLGFTVWGHLLNGSASAFGLFLTFKLYGYGEKRGKWFLQVLALVIFFAIGAFIPFMNDAEHLANHGQAATFPYISSRTICTCLRSAWQHPR